MGSIVIRRGKQLYVLDVIQFFRKGVGSRES
jgi:hypothetical protein